MAVVDCLWLEFVNRSLMEFVNCELLLGFVIRVRSSAFDVVPNRPTSSLPDLLSSPCGLALALLRLIHPPNLLISRR